jgi:hypothetical protein
LTVSLVVTLAFAALNTVAPTLQPMITSQFGWPFASDEQTFYSNLLLNASRSMTFSPERQQLHLVTANGVVAALVVVGSIIATERRRRAGRFRLRFTIQNLLVFTACAASFVAIERLRERSLNTAIIDLAIGVAIVGIILAWVALFDVLATAWNRLTSQRRATDAPDPESAPPGH